MIITFHDFAIGATLFAMLFSFTLGRISAKLNHLEIIMEEIISINKGVSWCVSHLDSINSKLDK